MGLVPTLRSLAFQGAKAASGRVKEAVSLSFSNCLQFQRECEAPAELDA